MDITPVKWIQKIDKKMKSLLNLDEVEEGDNLAFDTCVKHVSRLVGIRKQMFKDEITARFRPENNKSSGKGELATTDKDAG